MATDVWSLGVEISGIGVNQSITERSTKIYPTQIQSSTGTASDALSLRGSMLGVSLGRTFGERFPITVQLGAGGFFGGIRDKRNGTFTVQGPKTTSAAGTMADETYDVKELSQAQPARGFYIAPEVRFGIRIASRFDLAASLGAVVIVLANQPTWDPDAAHVLAGRDGLATFGAETLSSTTLFSFMPGIAATYRFF
jgi:hypothetical protein